tara:strand:- start:3118 stop:3378 length:261 start_codon:yes stop_codon:yes gene_type:complete
MKILITILLALFISSNASADFSYRELGSHLLVDQGLKGVTTINTDCIDGYKWVTVLHHNRTTDAQRTMAFEQFYIEKNGRAVPAKC